MNPEGCSVVWEGEDRFCLAFMYKDDSMPEPFAKGVEFQALPSPPDLERATKAMACALAGSYAFGWKTHEEKGLYWVPGDYHEKYSEAMGVMLPRFTSLVDGLNIWDGVK
jgi:hypothetical protein